MSSMRCPHCGRERNINLSQPCPNCGSKRIFGNYMFPHEFRSLITAISGAIFAILLFSLMGLWLFFLVFR